jgi:geranylgeranyl diphosphate synthase type II
MTALSQNVIPSSPDEWLHAARRDINLTLEALIPSIETWPKALHHAQHHALMAPGKRFRPILCLAITDGLKAPRKAALRIGAVAEIVHTASLILDDLPCMDDADLRRGRETVHLAFSESTAVLAATNLLNRAFGIAARSQSLTAEQRVDIIDSLSRSVGSSGLIAGQIADLANADMRTATSKVERVNALKTGALFDFTIEAAAIIGDASEEQARHLMAFSKQIGLAFQLLDDLKDEILSEAESQKSTKRDIGKATLVALEGQDGAMERLSGYMMTARASIKAAQLTTQATLLHVIDMQFSLPS